MGKNPSKTTRKIFKMKTFNIGQNNIIEPIEWTPYTGETVIVKTIIRKGQRI